MCGIAGFIDPRGQVHDPREKLASMALRLAHRGPDDSGVWWDESRRVGFAHRRLSIIDLSSAGHQPMHSASGRFTLVFNGEIYNAEELRQELDSHTCITWRGKSDTEVMLAAFEKWGVIDATQKFNGMFAFALFDLQTETIHLARDPIGKKPLYYGSIGRSFVFASELKALHALSDGPMDIDRGALSEFLRLGYVPGSQCIHPNLRKLQAGSVASMTLACAAVGGEATVKKYWNACESSKSSAASSFVGDDESLVSQMQTQLDRAVSRRMISDVPLGAFLSGGVDSALVTAFMSRASHSPIKTFTIGFSDDAYDESDRASATAKALGTDHTVVKLMQKDAMGVVPRLAEIYDEPFADSSQIPTVLLCAMARSQVTVALSGDGADELLGGYDRYVTTPMLLTFFRRCPQALRGVIAKSLSMALSTGKPVDALQAILPKSFRWTRLSDKLERLVSVLAIQSSSEHYRILASIGGNVDRLIIGSSDVPQTTEDETWPADTESIVERMMRLDFASYLVDDILVKVDRASMSVGLEVRSPFLDREFVEWAWHLPMRAKIRGGRGKWISYQLANRVIPGGFPNQPKMGFAVPIASWLRGDLRDWAEDLLDARRLSREGFLDPQETRRRWDAFVKGRNDERHLIWALLMFQSWLAKSRS